MRRPVSTGRCKYSQKKLPIDLDLISPGRTTQRKAPSSGACLNRPVNFYFVMGASVDKHVAAPAETRILNLHPAKSCIQECGWQGGNSDTDWVSREKSRSRTWLTIFHVKSGFRLSPRPHTSPLFRCS